jgi:hypothetical protein
MDIPLSSLRNFRLLSRWVSTLKRLLTANPHRGGNRLDSTLELLNGIEEELMARSFLFTDPVSYRDGVGATAEAVRMMVTKLRLVGQSAQKPREA